MIYYKLSFILLGVAITICDGFAPPSSYKHASKFHSLVHGTPSETVLYETNINEQQEKTLYDILNSPQNATREELKRNYIELVRKTHPDAQIGTDNAQDTDDEFQKVTQAWKTLSNPLERKRYDRILRAKSFTRDVESVMGEIGKTAGPQFLNVFENVAIPFMRKSAATVTAGFSAVSKDLKTYGEQDKKNEVKGLGGIISNAYSATKKAGDAIDMLDIMEKANELKKKAKQDMREVDNLKLQLNEMINKRMQLVLRTPKAKLSSLEALMILDGFNTLDDKSMIELLTLKKTVTSEIEQLQAIETEIESARYLEKSLMTDVKRQQDALEKAHLNVEAAKKAEERARKALEDAKILVQSTQNNLERVQSSLTMYTNEMQDTQYQINKVQSTQDKQQERVRQALRRKEQAVQKEASKKGHSSFPASPSEDFDENRAQSAMEEIKAMLEEEEAIREKIERLEAAAERELSRSQKLFNRSKELEKQEQEAWEALEEGLRVAEIAAQDPSTYSDQQKPLQPTLSNNIEN